MNKETEFCLSVAIALAAALATRIAMAVDPAIWYRADMGVTTNAQGKVTAWANQGTYGSGANLANTNAAAPGVAFVTSDSTMGGAPALELDGHDILMTHDAVSLGRLSEGGMWFVVFKSDVTGSDASNLSVFGHGTSNDDRFGVFRASTEKWRMYFYAGYYVDAWNVDTDPCLLSCGTFKPTVGNDSFIMRCWRRGEINAGDRVSWSARDADGKILVGGFNSAITFTQPFVGRIAEVRYYDTSLTAAERFCVECEMAARYAIPLANSGTFSFSANLLNGCTFDSAAFGSAYKWGKAVAQAATGAVSGALTVTFAETPSADTNLVYVAHDGGAGLARTWCVAGVDNARSTPLVLTFSGVEYTSDSDIALYRADGLVWTKLGAVKTASAESLSFELPAGWISGRYRAATPDAVVASSAAVWYRADKGVAVDQSGKVSSWTNSGFLGEDFNLAVAAEKPTLVADGIGSRPSIRFTSTNTYLRTAGEVDTGITSDGGGAYFVVCRFDSTKPTGTMCPFGIWSPAGSTSTGTQRFGLQAAIWPTVNYPVRPYFFCGYGSSYPLDLVRTTDSQMIGLGAYPAAAATEMRATQNGALRVASMNFSPFAGVLSVGEFNVTAFRAGYDGDVAEVRLYNRPLTAREFAAVELDISARYGIDMATCGSSNAVELASHAIDRKVIGISNVSGMYEENPPLTWSDGTLSFSFNTAPSRTDPNSPIAVLGHDGGATTFSQWRNAQTKSLGRTWFVSESNPHRGGIFVFSVDTTLPQGDHFCLFRKARSDTTFKQCDAEGVVSGSSVTFTLSKLESGTYRLVRKPIHSGFSIIFR